MPRILITRSPHQASELDHALRLRGVDTILIPTITFQQQCKLINPLIRFSLLINV